MRTRWEKYAALGGFWFVVFGLVGGFIAGAPPDPDAPTGEIVDYFRDKGDQIKASQILLAVASIGIIWWFGALYRRMARAESETPRLAVVAGLGLLWSGVFYLVSNAVNAAVAMRIEDGLGAARFFWALAGVLAATASVGVIVLLSAVGGLVMRSGIFPRWIAYLGWLGSVLYAIALIGAGSDATFFAIVGGLFGFLVWVVWLLATSWYMWSDEVPAAT